METYLNYVQVESDAVSDVYKDHLSKAKAACKNFKSDERTKCMIKAKIEGKKAELSKLKQMSSQCKSAQDPNACQRTLFQRAQKITKDTKNLLSKYQNISVKIKQKSQKNHASNQDHGYDQFEY